MSLLLDTHVILWFLANDSKLSAAARAAILDPATAIVEGLTLISADPRFDLYGLTRLW